MHTLIALAAIVAVNLQPGLNAPSTDGAARVEAAVLVSTNATATASVAAVYEVPTYGNVQHVTTLTNEVLTLTTQTVVGTNETLAVTDLYTISTNPTDRVTSLYEVTTDAAGLSQTNYLYIATNYFTVWTNSYPVTVLTPNVVYETNTVWELTGSKPVTNELFSLTASGGYAETNDVDRWIATPARLLLTGEPLTLIIER